MCTKKYKIGYTDGVYDLFHVGHLNMINTARNYCEYLIVGVHGDEVVREYKKRTPINQFRDKMKLWELYHFNVIFIGDDWKGTERWNHFEKILGEIGVDVIYVPYTKGISTTEIRQRIMNEEK